MKATMITKTEKWTTAASVGNPYQLELDDEVELVLFKACDNSDQVTGAWLWNENKWDGVSLEGLEELEKGITPKPPVKKTPVKEKPVTVDPKVYANAEAYSREFDKRQKAVKNAAEKVLK